MVRPGDADWLELAADLLQRPLTELPVEPIAELLGATFDAIAGYVESGAALHAVRPDGEPDVPEPFAEFVQRCAAAGAGEHLAFPLAAGPRPRSFVVGRRTPFSPRELAQAGRLCRLLCGIDQQSRAFAAALQSSARRVDEAIGAVRLTPRERGVLALLAEGHTAAGIARRLAIAERTVHKHLERCYAKLGVTDRLSAVLHAQRLGLIRSA